MNNLRWGVIGCGDVVRKRVAQAIIDAPQSELVAACRRNSDRLSEFCRQFNVAESYTQAADLIASDRVDAVYIATPVKDHLPQTVLAAKAGKHVLVEKPMAMTTQECDTMINICRESQVRLGVAYYRRYYPLVARIEQLLAEGAIGTPLAIAAVTSTPFAIAPGDEGYWRVIVEHGGGGALMDIGSHRINLFTHLFGPIREVRGLCRTIAAEYDVEDSAVVLFEFENDCVGTLQCHFGSAVDPDEFVITGTAGRLRAAPLNGNSLEIETAGDRVVERHNPPENLCGPLVADFTQAVLQGREPRVSGVEGRVTNAVIEAAYLHLSR